MAFYSYDAAREPVQTLGLNDRVRSDGVGAYYAQDQTHEAVQPVNGLSLGAQATETDHAIRAIIGKRKPLLVAREWAVRVTDIKWKAPSSMMDLVLLPITDRDLKIAEKAAGGHEVPMVAVITDRIMPMQQIADAFASTPYKMSEAIAVYGAGDMRALPVPRLLVTASEREPDDREGGHARLEDTARALGGALVYMVALPAKASRRLPPIEAALGLMQRGSVAMPGAPPPPPTADIVRPGGNVPTAGFEQKGVLGAVGLGAVDWKLVGIGAAIVAAGGVVAWGALKGPK